MKKKKNLKLEKLQVTKLNELQQKKIKAGNNELTGIGQLSDISTPTLTF